MMQTEEFQPRIVAFVCNWCTYIAADAAGVARARYSPNVRLIRTMCSGRVDPQFVFGAFEKGADGVLLCGCHPRDCDYSVGNYKALRRYKLLKKMLSQMGFEDDRFRLEWISASEAEKFRKVVEDMTERVRRLGPFKPNGSSTPNGGK